VWEHLFQIACPALARWTDKRPIYGEDAATGLKGSYPVLKMQTMRGCAQWPEWERPKEHGCVVSRSPPENL